MSSKVTATISLPSRRRRDSSDDFGAGSLGSIGGSEVGSSVASVTETPKGKDVDADAIPDADHKPTETTTTTITTNTTTPTKLPIHPIVDATPTTKNTLKTNDGEKKSAPVPPPAEPTKAGMETEAHVPTTSPPMSRRPFRKRKGSVDFTLSLDEIPDTPTGTESLPRGLRSTDDALPSVDALPSIDALPFDGPTASPLRMLKLRSDSVSSTSAHVGRRRAASVASLERLDALGEEARLAAARIRGDSIVENKRKGSTSDHSKNSSNGTFTSQSHRMLLEAFMGGDGGESLVDSQAAEEAEEHELTREERLGSFDVRERLGSFDVRERLASFDLSHDRLGSFDGRRERLESWGGMSDLSIAVPESSTIDSLIGGTSHPAALAAAVYSSLANDLAAAANPDGNESISSFLVHDDKIPTKISMTRDRLNSINSTATDPSISHLPLEDDIPSEIQKFVRAAMASVGEQLAEIAVAATEAIRDPEDHSEISSTASPIIGAVMDTGSKAGSWTQRPRSSSLSAAMDIAVDYDAVVAAVNAAEAAAGAIDLAAFAQSASASVSSSVSDLGSCKRKRPQLPLKKGKKGKSPPPTTSKATLDQTPKQPLHMELPPIPKSKMDERDLEIIRERARAAAGYVPPSLQTPGEKPPMPPKKKPKIENLNTPNVKTSSGYATPKTTNSAVSYKSVASTPFTPASSINTPASAKSTASKGQSSQKWDSMFECLLEFVDERKQEETKDASDDEKKEWIWDGNVPTTYKTKDGKALGRWVNNQRSAKSKGVLKGDREKRLIDAGLKWSVLASNSWNEMLEELRIYVNEHTKSGRKWDGNVPTNYRIKTKAGAAIRDDEDKNLGRWVNRQRSLYQAGKLRKDRQLALEKVGLKWSMLATTSWESMFETLCEYVASKTKDGAEWDGNVPANYRTTDNPPRALGRWINRQRSAYGKDKIKAEYVDKLNKLGLKWSVHERRPNNGPDTVQSTMTGGTSVNDDTNSMAPSEASSSDNQDGDDNGFGDDKEDEDTKVSQQPTTKTPGGKSSKAVPTTPVAPRPEPATSNPTIPETSSSQKGKGNNDDQKDVGRDDQKGQGGDSQKRQDDDAQKGGGDDKQKAQGDESQNELGNNDQEGMAGESQKGQDANDKKEKADDSHDNLDKNDQKEQGQNGPKELPVGDDSQKVKVEDGLQALPVDDNIQETHGSDCQKALGDDKQERLGDCDKKALGAHDQKDESTKEAIPSDKKE